MDHIKKYKSRHLPYNLFQEKKAEKTPSARYQPTQQMSQGLCVLAEPTGAVGSAKGILLGCSGGRAFREVD